MIEIDGKYYVIDMDKMMAWVSETPSTEKNINIITTMTYPITNDDDEEEIVEKEVSESKSSLNEIMNNVRYDFIRSMISTLFSTFTNDMGEMVTTSLNGLSFGQKIAFNTLYYKRIIIEVTKTDNE